MWKATAAIVCGMVLEAGISMYMPIPVEIAATGVVTAYASVKIDEWFCRRAVR